MTDGARQRSSTAGSAKLGAADDGQESGGGGGVALKKEIGLVSACGIIVGEYARAYNWEVCTFSEDALFSRLCSWDRFC